MALDIEADDGLADDDETPGDSPIRSVGEETSSTGGPTDDRVLSQLRRLREGSGATLDRLKAAGNVMSALGTSDPTEALERLVQTIGTLPDVQAAGALMVDYGLDLAERLGRPPHERESRYLGDRRAAYAEVVQRDVKTLARWSDRAAADLRGRLLSDTFDGDLFVVGHVKGNRTLGFSLILNHPEPVEGSLDGSITRSESFDITNRFDGPSLPAIVYGYPRDWRPRSLTIVASFQTPVPDNIWAVAAANFHDLSFAGTKHELEYDDESGYVMCKFVGPRRDRIYGIVWER